MLSLILISVFSLLFLLAMIFLRLSGCRFKYDSFLYDFFKKTDERLSEYWDFLKNKVEKYGNGLPLLIFIGKFLLVQIIRLFDIFSFLLKKTSSKLKRYLRRVNFKEKNETVSEYLRSISDYKNNER